MSKDTLTFETTIDTPFDEVDVTVSYYLDTDYFIIYEPVVTKITPYFREDDEQYKDDVTAYIEKNRDTIIEYLTKELAE